MGLFDFFKKTRGKKEAHFLDNLELTLLKQYLSAMPPLTQIDQYNRFYDLKADFEFGTWIPLNDVDKLVKRFMDWGFTVWCNADSRTAFLYGAKKLKKEEISDLVMKISRITVKGKKGQAFVNKEDSQPQFITIQGQMFK
ncbi:hypothetical protein JW879_03815 [candidate division WOR-3 bacterium]|nr:hypothetical protein [candidate division WOR-3 bacterium]